MSEKDFSKWVDDYVRDRLSDEDAARFEEALLEDTELQESVEIALGVQEVIRNEPIPVTESTQLETSGRNSWSGLALAASVILAVVSTTLFWRAGVENEQLQSRLEALTQPVVNVLQVPVNIMRSGNQTSPDVIVQIPDGRSAILLDIELGLLAREESVLNFSF